MSRQDLLIVNGNIHTPNGFINGGYVLVNNGILKEIGKNVPEYIPQSTSVIDAMGKNVLPGFIDIHVNGGGGHLAVDGHRNAIISMAIAHAKYGTTAMVPTTISVDEEKLIRTISAVSELVEIPTGGAEVLGIHLEGPFLNPTKRGAHRKEFLKLPSVKYFNELSKLAKGSIRILSLAPELEGSEEVIHYAQQNNVLIALAHSDADYQMTLKAINSGMTLCSHLFNAMQPLTHRMPGPIGAFLTTPNTYVELISDGVHVHPAVMEIAIKAKGPSGVALVTDAVTPAGTSMTKFDIMGTQLEVKGNSCYSSDGNLAGSALTMNKAVQILIEKTSVSFNDAVMMASMTPATLLGLGKRKGSLEVGKDADIVIVDADWNVYATVVGGIVVHKA